jgi:hypothetical protein
MEKIALVVDEYPISFATCSHYSPGDTVFFERLREGCLGPFLRPKDNDLLICPHGDLLRSEDVGQVPKCPNDLNTSSVRGVTA